MIDNRPQELPMSWTTPEVKEICVGMEINDYMPAEF
ncbi:coenzyme PQQ precursor peptide PqqA [Salinicola sp. MH3R3-1]|nr:coenzyme PQQ precursor peptide PqqA [Salinicola sp. MH3R3-1]